MNLKELLVLIQLARRAMIAGLGLGLAAAALAPALGYLERAREATLAQLATRLEELKPQAEKLARDVADLERLSPRVADWRSRGVIASTDRAGWFEALTALVGERGQVELQAAVALNGLDNAWRHPLKIAVSGILDSEALALAQRLEDASPIPLRIERIALKERAEAGLNAELAGALIHLDPASAHAAGLTTLPGAPSLLP